MRSTSPPLDGLGFSLVGPGRVGSSLAYWAVARGAELQAVVGRRSHRAHELATVLSGGTFTLEQLDSRQADLLVIAVSDEALGTVAHQLAKRPQSAVVLHTSGRADASVLSGLRKNGSAVGSLHPLKAFPRVLTDPREAEGTVFALDGDPAAQAVARRLVRAWVGIPVLVAAEKRPLYHLAATLSAGGVVTLLASACELAARLGLPPEVEAGYLALAQGALAHAQATGDPARAITGPVARGDIEGFEAQLDQLRHLDPELAELLAVLARRTRHHCAPRES